MREEMVSVASGEGEGEGEESMAWDSSVTEIESNTETFSAVFLPLSSSVA